jgi:hypothetical protein
MCENPIWDKRILKGEIKVVRDEVRKMRLG